MSEVSISSGSEYVPDPPSLPTPGETRGKSKVEHEQDFARSFFIQVGEGSIPPRKYLIDSREFVDKGHPCRMVYTPDGTFLVSVRWLGPQTLTS